MVRSNNPEKQVKNGLEDSLKMTIKEVEWTIRNYTRYNLDIMKKLNDNSMLQGQQKEEFRDYQEDDIVWVKLATQAEKRRVTQKVMIGLF